MTLPEPHEQQRQPVVSKRKRTAFLEALTAGFSVTYAAKAAGVHRSSFYRLRERDKAFEEAWSDAYEAGTDVLRDELRRRAVDGWEEPMVSAGKVVAHVRKYSDRLLELELKRRDSSYREHGPQAVAINVNASQTIQPGVSLASAAKVLLDAGVDLAALAAGRELEAGEIIAETDEPTAAADEEGSA